MDDGKLRSVWKISRHNLIPEGGSVWAGRLCDFRKTSMGEPPPYAERVGSYVLAISEVGELTFIYDSYECDGEKMIQIQKHKKGAIAVLSDLVSNGLLREIKE
jgi:hypothetical protein